MENVFNYIQKEGKRSFLELGFGSVDALIFSQLTYLNYDAAFAEILEENRPMPLMGIAPFAKSGLLFQGIRVPKECEKLFCMFAKSRRYMDVTLSNYVNDINTSEEKQFSAMVFNLPDGTDFVAFRGTDNTIVGWKEDFNMTFMSAIPAQTESVSYLNRVAKMSDRPLRVGGHSKGGNLAVFSSVKCDSEVKKRISEIYSLDGPGFRKDFLTNIDFLEVKDRIKKFLPQSSIIGMLMYNQENYTVISSNKFGIMQHDLFTWQVENGNFMFKESVGDKSLLLDRTISDWLSSLDDEKRKIFFDTLYNLVKQTNARTLEEFNSEKKKNSRIMLHAVKEVDNQTKKFVLKAFASLFLLAPKAYKDIRVINLKKNIKSNKNEKEK